MATQGSGDFAGGSANQGTGLEPNVAAALSYVLGIVTGVIFVLLERNQFVRFHAFQSILLSVAWIAFWVVFTIIGTVLGFVPVLGILAALVGLLLSLGLGLGAMILWIILMIKAYQGQKFMVPYIGPMAERYALRQQA